LSISSVCVYENHINCDNCLLDSADIEGVSQYSNDPSGKMTHIRKTVKEKGWYINGDLVYCDKCRVLAGL